MSNISKGIRAGGSFTLAIAGTIIGAIISIFTAIATVYDFFPGAPHGKTSTGDRLYVLALFLIGLTFCVGFGIYIRGRVRRWKGR